MPTSLYGIAHVIFKRRAIVLLALALILSPAIIGALVSPTAYRAAARLMVTQTRAYRQVSAQPENRNVPVTDVQLIAATAQTLSTRAFFREVAERLETDGATNGFGNKSPKWWTQHLLKRVEVTPLSNAPLIEVAYRAEDPELSAHVVNTVVKHYIGYQARAMFDNPTLRAFYAAQQGQLEQELQIADLALTRFQKDNQIYAIDTQRTHLARLHAEALQALELNAGQIRQAETEARALTRQLERLPAQVALHTYGESPRLTTLSQKVVELEIKLNDLRQMYTDEDRRVRDVLEELARAEDLLLAEEANAGTTPTMTRLESNDAYQNILENALREEAAAEALRARREDIENMVNTTVERLEALNRVGFEYDRLKATRDAKQTSYTQFTTLLEQARAAEAMDQEGLTNVRIVDQATVPTRPVPRRRWLMLALGLLTGLGVGVAGAFGVEALSPTVHDRTDGEARLALPVLGVVPEDV